MSERESGSASSLPWAASGFRLPWYGDPAAERAWHRKFIVAASEIDAARAEALRAFDSLPEDGQQQMWQTVVAPWFDFLNSGRARASESQAACQQFLEQAAGVIHAAVGCAPRSSVDALGGPPGVHIYLDLLADAFLAWGHVNSDPNGGSDAVPRFSDDPAAALAFMCNVRAVFRERLVQIVVRSGLLDVVVDAIAGRKGLSRRAREALVDDLRGDILVAVADGASAVPPPRASRSKGRDKNVAWALRLMGSSWSRHAAARRQQSWDPAMLSDRIDQGVDVGRSRGPDGLPRVEFARRADAVVDQRPGRAEPLAPEVVSARSWTADRVQPAVDATRGRHNRRARSALLSEYRAGSLSVTGRPDATRLATEAGVSKSTISRQWAELRRSLRTAEDEYVRKFCDSQETPGEGNHTPCDGQRTHPVSTRTSHDPDGPGRGTRPRPQP